MRTHCQFTVKRPERSVDLTVAPEQQPCGVQVVEWSGLVTSSFQFFTRLAAVFADHHQRKEGSGRRLIHVAS